MIWTATPIWMKDPLSVAEDTGRTETCLILGNGPSLSKFDPAWLYTCPRVITINDAWRVIPADVPSQQVSYFCDATWWTDQMQRNPRSLDWNKSFHDAIYKNFWVTGAYDFFHDHPQVRALKFSGQTGLEMDPGSLRHGSNSGYQAINLAVHLGVKRIVLLGYDMQAVNGQMRWHGDGPTIQEVTFTHSFIPLFSSLVKPLKKISVEVINATPNSRLTCFPMKTLEEIFNVSRKTCEHERLNEEGICRNCGRDCRGG